MFPLGMKRSFTWVTLLTEKGLQNLHYTLWLAAGGLQVSNHAAIVAGAVLIRTRCGRMSGKPAAKALGRSKQATACRHRGRHRSSSSHGRLATSPSQMTHFTAVGACFILVGTVHLLVVAATTKARHRGRHRCRAIGRTSSTTSNLEVAHFTANIACLVPVRTDRLLVVQTATDEANRLLATRGLEMSDFT